MAKVLGRRVLHTIPLLLGVAFVVLLLIDIAPDDIAVRVAGDEATPEQVDAIRGELGLDRPFIVRYVDYVGNAVRGDLGNSLFTRERVSTMLADRLPVTLSLAGISLVFGVTAGVGLGLASAIRPNGLIDRAIGVACSFAVATPSFLIALVLVIVLAVDRAAVPATGYVPFGDGAVEWFRHLLLPAVALAALPAAEIARQLRGSMIEVGERDYMLAGRARGISTTRLRFKHALKNAAIPPVTVLGFRVAQMIGGTVVIERLFLLPGLGQMTIESVQLRDYTALVGAVLVSALIVSVISLLVDASYAYFNPKLRHS